jgi:serine/threonine protein kinase
MGRPGAKIRLREPKVPARTLSRYELLEEIGRGNMGVVYRARDPAMDRRILISPAVEPTPEVVEEEAIPFAPLGFVARHEHAIGHCTGDLSLGETGIVFRSSRHVEWRWQPREVDRLSLPSETELDLHARSKERGIRAKSETFRFTLLRPVLAREDFQRYRKLLGSGSHAE